jgi:Tfp pilus assembly protein PilF
MTWQRNRSGGFSFPLLFLCALFLANVRPAAAQTQPGGTNPGVGSGRGPSHTIRGKIFLPSGNPPEQRIRVVLEINTGGIAGEAFSDSVGNFEFRSLSNGVYRITVPTDTRTYETAQETVELYGAFSRTVSAQIYLRDKNAEPGFRPRERVLSAADIQEVPKEAKKAYEKGLKRAGENKPQEAVAGFEQALKLFPDYLHALNKLGEQKAILQAPDEARAAFEKAIAVNPKFALPHINLGMLLVNQNRFDDAVAPLEQGNRLDDSYPMSHLNLGLALMQQTTPDLDRAEKELTRAMELGKGSLVTVRKYLFNLNARRRTWDKAIAHLEAYLKEAPDAPDAAEVRNTLARATKLMTDSAAAPKN